jgi:hypothetical protein
MIRHLLNLLAYVLFFVALFAAVAGGAWVLGRFK